VTTAKDRADIPELDGSRLRVAVVGSRWNRAIVDRLRDGAHRGLRHLGVQTIDDYSVPGAFELPFAARRIADAGEHNAIVVIGAVIRGDTTHYELITNECAAGIQRVQLESRIPIGFGVLTVENEAQATERSEGPGGHNVGEEAAAAAIELALFAG
jgi:6,7-dimethyl-8-ribityllumazine synthase